MNIHVLLLLFLLVVKPVRIAAELIESSFHNATLCDGTEDKGQFCYIATSTFPRECDCVKNVCLPGGIANTINCFTCNRGYGIYLSYEECIGNKVAIQSTRIDPATYPAPSYPATSCPARSSPPEQGRQNCPFWQQGLRNWDDPSTWGGQVPGPWEVITLPKNTKVLVGACMVQKDRVYKQIIIPENSELVLADEDMEIKVASIIVFGALRAGSSTCVLGSRITFSFFPYSGIDPYDKAIWVRPGGQLDLHGRVYTPTWTRLAQTAMAATNYLQLQDPVNWEAGQQLVVTTTIWKDEQENQNEVKTVALVENNGRTVYLREPLQYQHYGGPEYQAEVGLLSRSILIQGDKSVEGSKRGPHVRVEGEARIRGAQTYRAGQLNIKGAYPFHFHFVGDGTNSLVTDSSVYNSQYRCFVIHATNNLLVQNNVGFHTNGHCYYLEDGVEEYNTLDHNLAAFVHVIGRPAAGFDQTGQTFGETPSFPQPTDSAASGFYALNLNNRWTNNAASGGYSGFIFTVAPRPIGYNRWQSLVPASRPLLRFDGNTAHSSGYMWFQAGCFYFGGKLWEDPNDNNRLYYNSGRHEFTTMDAAGKKPAFVQLTNNKVFLCMVGHMSWGQRFEVVGYEAYDIVRGATLFGEGLLKNGYVNYVSSNNKNQFPGLLSDLPPPAGFQWYDTRTMTIIKDWTFANYKYKPQLGYYAPSVFYSMTHSDEFKPMGMSSTQNISYINVDHAAIARVDVHETGSSRMFNWLDFDGSASERSYPSIIGSWPSWWQVSNDCAYENTWNAWVCHWRPGQEVGRLEIRIPGVTVAWDTGKALPPTPEHEIGYVALFGYRGNQARKMTITKNEGVTGVTGNTGWYASYNAGAPRYHELWLSQVPPSTHIIYATRYPPGSKFRVRRIFRWYPSQNKDLWQASSLDQVVAGDGTNYHWDGRRLYVKLVDPGGPETRNIDFTRDGVTVRGYRYWSLYYSVQVTNKNCGTFCWVDNKWDDIPPAIGTGSSGGAASSACTDTQPTDGTTCAQKKAWGQCSADWMTGAGWCAATCGRCYPPPSSLPAPGSATGCFDIQPTDGTSCSQQKLWGKCSEPWMAGSNWCAATCGRCRQPSPSISPIACTDRQPPGGFSCAQQKAWGKCSEAWMRTGGYCAPTCGFCSGGAAVNFVAGIETVGMETEEGPAACTDTTPPGRFSCREQEVWGACPLLEGTGFCAVTCGRCTPQLGPCTDIPTPDGVSCLEKQAQGKCVDPYLQQGGYCERTCGVCGQEGPTIQSVACTDLPTPDGSHCKELRVGGQCNSTYLVLGNYCNLSCGRCSLTAVQEEEGGVVLQAAGDGWAGMGGIAEEFNISTLAEESLSLPSVDVEEEEQDGVAKEGGEGRRRLLVDECPQLAAEEAEL